MPKYSAYSSAHLQFYLIRSIFKSDIRLSINTQRMIVFNVNIYVAKLKLHQTQILLFQHSFMSKRYVLGFFGSMLLMMHVLFNS